MANERRNVYPGGYRKTVFREGFCSCCLVRPIAKGNYFLCNPCHTDEIELQHVSKGQSDIVTKEEALELCVKVAIMEEVPPIPVKHFSCDDYTQEELQAILNGGATC